MIRHPVWKKSAARILVLAMTAGLAFPGTVYAAQAPVPEAGETVFEEPAAGENLFAEDGAFAGMADTAADPAASVSPAQPAEKFLQDAADAASDAGQMPEEGFDQAAAQEADQPASDDAWQADEAGDPSAFGDETDQFTGETDPALEGTEGEGAEAEPDAAEAVTGETAEDLTDQTNGAEPEGTVPAEGENEALAEDGQEPAMEADPEAAAAAETAADPEEAEAGLPEEDVLDEEPAETAEEAETAVPEEDAVDEQFAAEETEPAAAEDGFAEMDAAAGAATEAVAGETPAPEEAAEAARKSSASYKVSFDLNGGALADRDFSYKDLYTNGRQVSDGDSVYIPTIYSYNEEEEPTVIRTGYRFDGWTEVKDGTDLVSGSYYPTKDTVLYAKWTRVFTVKFNLAGGKWKDDYYSEQYGNGKRGEKGTTLYLPSSYYVERSGYEFQGWSETQNGTVLSGSNYTFAKDVTLYAKWEKLYTIKFDTNGGVWTSDYYAESYGSGVQEKLNETTYLPGSYTISRSGYIFKGWTMSRNAGTILNGSYKVTKNLTLYASWAKSYKVTFNAGSGYFGTDTKATRKVLEVEAGENIGNYIEYSEYTPQKGSYVFLGWYKDIKFTSPVKKSDTITKNITYYARWQSKSYKITVTNLKGASYHNRATGEYIYGDKSTANSYAFYIAQGDSIGSIYAYKDGTNARFFFDKTCKTKPYYDEFVPTGNTTVYAKWDTEVTITWNANGGKDYSGKSSGKVTSKKGLMCEDLPDSLTKAGYYFVGWYDTANASKILPASHVFTKNTTVKAKWAKGIKITFKPNGGTFPKGVRSAIYIKVKTKIGSEAPWSVTKSGYKLKGWKNSVTGKVVTNLHNEAPAKATTYTAVWVKAATTTATVTVTLQADAGSIYDWNNRKYVTKFSVKVPKNATLASTEIYSHEPAHDEAFKHLYVGGWSLKKGGTSISAGYKFTKNITLYPVWKKRTGLTVALVTNGGAVDKDPDNDPIIYGLVKSGSTISLPTGSHIEREGYTFVGWCLDAALTKKISNPAKFKVTSNRYLYAKWKKK